MELNHFCHEHPLILYQEQENKYSDDEEVVCHACVQPILQGDPTYGCTKCSLFLHKSCAELPTSIKHHLHPRHRLTLIADDCLRSRHEGYDDACEACHEVSNSFYYTCSSCKFKLDITCASLPERIESACHDEHPLTLLRQPATFVCDFCRQDLEGRSMSYLCTTCHFLVHPKCALLPSTDKFACHDHPLSLTNSDQLGHDFHDPCLICDETVRGPSSNTKNKSNRLYYCADCSCAAHVDCTKSERMKFIRDKRTPVTNKVFHRITNDVKEGGLREEMFLVSTDKRTHVKNKMLDIVSNDVKEEGLREEMMVAAMTTTRISHFSHDHSLTLCNELKNPDEKCDGCAQSISNNTPFYHCFECPHYFLHKTCAELPTSIKHPYHINHRLTLLARSPSTGGVFTCDACLNFCNGFSYNCKKCEFNLDIQCSLIQNTLRHEAHEHDLVLQSYTNHCCNGCGNLSYSARLRCAEGCYFRLCMDCAILPQTGKHRCHRHVLSLTYSTVKDDSDEYYCDTCEEERQPDHWTYRCAESSCDISAHLKCIRGQYPRIKFGSMCKIDDHPHHVRIVQKEHEYSPCEECRFPRTIIAFECAICCVSIEGLSLYSRIYTSNCDCWKLNPSGLIDLTSYKNLQQTR